MKLYLDTSILIVYLFGKEKEPERFKAVSKLFDRINNRELQAAISLYSFQEVIEYIKDTFPPYLPAEILRLSLLLLLRNRLEILSLLPREVLLSWKKKFFIRDRSDRPHVVSALYNNCQAIVAYDDHFNDVDNIINHLEPEELSSPSDSNLP